MRNKFLLVIFGLIGVTTFSQDSIPYNLKLEDQTIVLPSELREVSGITIIDSKTLGCVQDEEGLVFIYDLKKQAIKQKIRFAGPGDYEGIALVGKDLFVLRSDATLFRIHEYQSVKRSIDSIKTGIPNKDNEGLCFDSKNKRLLIGSKSKIAKGSEYKNLRTIYAFDLTQSKLEEKPLYTYDINSIKEFAARNHIQLPTKPGKKNPGEQEAALKFQLSGIYIHPKSNLLYVLSASDYYLFVFDSIGNIIHLEVLDPEKFNKAEGIAIMPNGNLYISNEGQTGDPKILRFSEDSKN
ncbi:SdiA-regulated domain-containing protein [Fluviicola sp.]|uniref:SdiA-regulated domain-containing protein n=1 Tax=Fluviicola sp. TaxID=1917219 RepID=UPI003D2E643A